MAIFFNFSLTSSHVYPLQVENCDSNSRLVVDEDDNGKFRPERVKGHNLVAPNQSLADFLESQRFENAKRFLCFKNNCRQHF